MDKQPFDHIDNRIRQAADKMTVPFSEEAWKKMEVKLDNEFNKDRRRGIIWWWFSFMLLGIAVSGIYIINHKPAVPAKKIANSSSSKNTEPPLNNKAISRIDTLSNENIERFHSEKKESVTQDNQKEDEGGLIKEIPDDRINSTLESRSAKVSWNRIKKEDKFVTVNKSTRIFKSNYSNKLLTTSVKRGSATPIEIFKSTSSKESYNRTNKLRENKYNTIRSSDSSSIASNPVLDSSLSTVPAKIVKIPESASQKDTLTSSDNVSKKNTQVKLDVGSSKGFYFLASVAGEATGIKNISIKDTKPVYGVGIGYRFNKKLSVQTGFYFGKEIYSAEADDYKVTPGSYIAKFISAEAECYIYDIPITVRYDMIHKKVYDFYVTTGISSFILKRETYDMHFFNPAGMYRHMPYTYKNNIGYLSVFNISLGYERKLSNAISVQAEPYLKLPLAGLGEGSVKLYSAGLQLGLKYQLLKRKK